MYTPPIGARPPFDGELVEVSLTPRMPRRLRADELKIIEVREKNYPGLQRYNPLSHSDASLISRHQVQKYSKYDKRKYEYFHQRCFIGKLPEKCVREKIQKVSNRVIDRIIDEIYRDQKKVRDQQLSQQVLRIEKNSMLFFPQISFQNGKAVVALDFSDTPLDEYYVFETIKTMMRSKEHGDVFVIKEIIHEKLGIRFLLEKVIQEQIRADPRTRQDLPTDKSLFEISVSPIKDLREPVQEEKKEGDHIKFNVNLNFRSVSSCRLNMDELQYCLWKVIKAKGYGTLFEAKFLDLGNGADLERFVTGAGENQTYPKPKINEKEIVQTLGRTVIGLNLAGCLVTEEILSKLAEVFRNVKYLRLDAQAIKTETIFKMFAYLQHYSWSQPISPQNVLEDKAM